MYRSVGSKRYERSCPKSGIKIRKKELVEEIFPPRYSPGDKDVSSEQDSNHHSTRTEAFMSHRSCAASPNRTDFCQIVDFTDPRTAKAYADKYQQILLDQYGFDPIEKLPKHQVLQLQDVMRLLTTDPRTNEYKTEQIEDSHIQTSDGAQWQTVDSPDDVDKYLSPDLSCLREYPVSPSSPIGIPLDPVGVPHKHRRKATRDKDRSASPCSEQLHRKRKNPLKDKSIESLTRDRIRISETPRVKVIAEKYSKFKKKNIEIRKLEEKVVCVEYDVFDKRDMNTPRQKLRSFFSIKPVTDNKEESDVKQYPTTEVNYQMDEYDLKRLTNKEIEIIDGKLKENESYLKDLRRILKKKKTLLENSSNTDLNTPALMGLYDLAKHEETCQGFISKTQVLSGDKLEEMKNMIVNQASNTLTGIDRRKVKTNVNVNNNFKLLKGSSIISQSFFNELLRESSKAY